MGNPYLDYLVQKMGAVGQQPFQPGVSAPTVAPYPLIGAYAQAASAQAAAEQAARRIPPPAPAIAGPPGGIPPQVQAAMAAQLAARIAAQRQAQASAARAQMAATPGPQSLPPPIAAAPADPLADGPVYKYVISIGGTPQQAHDMQAEANAKAAASGPVQATAAQGDVVPAADYPNAQPTVAPMTDILAAKQAALIAQTTATGRTQPRPATAYPPVPQDIVDTLPGSAGNVNPTTNPDPTIGSLITTAISDPIGSGKTVVNDAAQFALQDIPGSIISKAEQIPGVGPYVKQVVDALQYGYEQATEQTGYDIYLVANDPGHFVYNPYYYKDAWVETFARDPKNKDAINAVYTNGLDLDGNGTIDVTGSKAVWLYANAQANPDDGFITQMIDQLGFDPLFAAQVGGEAALAGGLEYTGTALDNAAATGAATTPRLAILKAADAALQTAEKIKTAPKRAASAAGAKVGTTVRNRIGWLGEPAESTAARDIENAAADAANQAQMASAVPSYNTPYGGKAEYSTPATSAVADAGDLPGGSVGETGARVADETPTPAETTVVPKPEEPVQTEPQPKVPAENVHVNKRKDGYGLSVKVEGRWKKLGESYETKAEAETAKRRYIETVSTEIPTEKVSPPAATKDIPTEPPPTKPVPREEPAPGTLEMPLPSKEVPPPRDPRVANGFLLEDEPKPGETWKRAIYDENPVAYRNIQIKHGEQIARFQDWLNQARGIDAALIQGAWAKWLRKAAADEGVEITHPWTKSVSTTDATKRNTPFQRVLRIIFEPDEAATKADRSALYATGELRKTPPAPDLGDRIRNADVNQITVTLDNPETGVPGDRVTLHRNGLKAMAPEERDRIARLAVAEQTRAYKNYQRIQSVRAGLHAPADESAALKADLGVPDNVGVPASARPEDVVAATQELRDAIAEKVDTAPTPPTETPAVQPEPTPIPEPTTKPRGSAIAFEDANEHNIRAVASGMGEGDIVAILKRDDGRFEAYGQIGGSYVSKHKLRATIEEAQADARALVAQSRKAAREAGSEFRVGEVRIDGPYRRTARVEGPNGGIDISASKNTKEAPNPRKTEPVWNVVEQTTGSTGIHGYTPSVRTVVAGNLTFADAVEAAKRYLTRGQAANFISPEVRTLMGITDAIGDRLTPARAEIVPSSNFPVPGTLGEAERFGATGSEAAIQSARGAIPPEAAAYLDEPVTVYEAKLSPFTGKRTTAKTGQWKRISKKQYREWSKQSGLRDVGEGGVHESGTLRAVKTTKLGVLEDLIRDDPSLTGDALTRRFVETMRDLTGKEPKAAARRWSALHHIKATAGTLNHVAASMAIHNIFRITHALTNDALESFNRIALSGHFGAAVEAFNPVELAKIIKHEPTELDRAMTALGDATPHEIKAKHQLSEVGGSTGEERTPTHKALSDAFRLEEGSGADRAVGLLSGVLDNRKGTQLRAATDNLRRETVMKSALDEGIGATGREFRRRARNWAERNGIEPQMVDAYTHDLGRYFSPEDVRTRMHELASDAGLAADAAVNFADHLASEWMRLKNGLRNKALAESNKVNFSFRRYKGDELIGKFVLYHYWMSRAVPAYLRIALRKPWVAAMWLRMAKEVHDRFEQSGYPDSMRGFVRFAGSAAAGYSWALDPLNILVPFVDSIPDDPQGGWLDKASQVVSFNPVMRTAFSVMGWTDELADPLMTSGPRAAVLAIVNDIRAHTGRAPITDLLGYNRLLLKAETLANHLGRKLPLGKPAEFFDPRTTVRSTINYGVATVIEGQTGKPVEQWGKDQWDAYEQAVNDGWMGVPNPIFDEAFRQYADANLKGQGMAAVGPTHIRTRLGLRDEYIAMGQSYDAMTDAQKTAKGYLNAGGPEDLHLQRKQDEYANLGTEEQRTLAQHWNDIVYGVDEPDRIPGASTFTVMGQTYTAFQIKQLPHDDRVALADAWVAEQGGTLELKQYRELQDKFKTDNPEYGDVAWWKKIAGDYPGGVRAFREDRAKGNPNFRAAMARKRKQLEDQGTDKALIETELDRWATSLAGYEAAHGIKSSVYDPDPTSTGDQATVDTILKSVGTGSGYQQSTPQTTAANLKKDIRRFKEDAMLADAILANYGFPPGSASSHDPYMREAVRRVLGNNAPVVTDLMRQYFEWQQYQQPGADTSVDAFGNYLDKLQSLPIDPNDPSLASWLAYDGGGGGYPPHASSISGAKAGYLSRVGGT